MYADASSTGILGAPSARQRHRGQRLPFRLLGLGPGTRDRFGTFLVLVPGTLPVRDRSEIDHAGDEVTDRGPVPPFRVKGTVQRTTGRGLGRNHPQIPPRQTPGAEIINVFPYREQFVFDGLAVVL